LGIETEVKIRIENADEFSRELQPLNPAVLSARHFEDNHILDFEDGRVGSSRSLIRVRLVDGQHFFTYKGPPRREGIFKTREELETSVADGVILLQALERIGLRVSFRYQKYRREFLVDGVHVAVDETPIGIYVELEGSEQGIVAIAEKLGIAQMRFLRSSYFSLYLDYCNERGVNPGFMVFDRET
jgi:adenylate cyclase, class 2